MRQVKWRIRGNHLPDGRPMKSAAADRNAVCCRKEDVLVALSSGAGMADSGRTAGDIDADEPAPFAVPGPSFVLREDDERCGLRL